MTVHWAVACFEEGPVLWDFGPTIFIEMMPLLIAATRQEAWDRFLVWNDDENTPARQRYWRKRGYRPMRVGVTVELLEKVNA